MVGVVRSRAVGRRDPGRIATGSAIALFAAYVAFHLTGWGTEPLRIAVTNLLYLPLGLVAVALGVRAARAMVGQARRAWWFITGAFAAGLLGNAVWFWLEVVRQEIPAVSLADLGYLAFFPLFLVGLLLVPRPRPAARHAAMLVLDVIGVVAGMFMIVWYVVLGPVATTGTADVTATLAIAYPVADLVGIVAVATVLVRGVDPMFRRPLRILVGALALFIIADIYNGFIGTHEAFLGGDWLDLCWLAANVLFVASAADQHRRARADRAAGDSRRTRAALAWLPPVVVAAAYGLLLVVTFNVDLYPLGGMIVGAAVLTGVVVLRQVGAVRENRDLAVTDGLTGLANRAMVQERLRGVVRDARRSDRLVGVLIADLDGFKQVNEALGHGAGDAMLVAVADAVRSVVRTNEIAGRLGGDEFVVVFGDLSGPEAAVRVAERIVASLRAPILFDGHILQATASIGVAVAGADGVTADDLLQRADIAMQVAKLSGPGRVELYSPDLHPSTRDSELRAAIENEQMVVHYQPIVDLETGAAVGVEALVRWRHPGRGLLGPDTFVPLAEETQLIVPLGAWVLRHACEQVQRWQREIPGSGTLKLAVNVSATQVRHPSFVATVTRILTETGFDSNQLVLELTEALPLHDDAATLGKIEALRGLGVRVAVDDFGTGYSSLSYLRRLPIDILKIDRSFVTDIASHLDGWTIGSAMVNLGRALKLEVVAEGIETDEQLKALRRMRCEHGQGYHLARPQDPEATARTLARMVEPRPRRGAETAG
jgi:diguanylate cyclase